MTCFNNIIYVAVFSVYFVCEVGGLENTKPEPQGSDEEKGHCSCSEAHDQPQEVPKLVVTDEISRIAPGHGLWDDMLLPLDFFNKSTKGSGGTVEAANVISNPRARWPRAVVPYIIHSSLEGSRNQILKAFGEYHQKTCVRFVERTNQRNFIHIFRGNGCYASVGMTDTGAQPVSLGNGCLHHGLIVHELGHALGLYHEQCREDRDNYVIVYYQNINPGYESQFTKLTPPEEILYTKYDTDSIMHYGEYSFSKTKNFRTMISRSGKPLLEPFQKPGLTPSDAYEIRKAYKCSDTE